MRRLLFCLVSLVLLMLVPLSARADSSVSLASAGDTLLPEISEPSGTGLSLRVDYLGRQSAVEEKDYSRLSLSWDSGERFLNPRGGVEFRMEDGQLRSYWIGDDIIITDRTRLHLRLNHLEYGDWETAINHANFYFSYHRWWFRGAVGLGYAALVFEDKYYRDPTHYTSTAPESRVIYELSLRPSLWEDRIELGFGFRNFDNFEYHGADSNGYHIEPIFHLTDSTTLSAFYERRYSGVFISVPTLNRVTWMVSVEHTF
ncbi:MAG: hypothetical protein R6V10_12345 [bacterium]